MFDVKPSSKLIVLFKVKSDFMKYVKFLRILGEHEVVFIDVRRFRMIINVMESSTEFDYFVKPDHLFTGTLSKRFNLHGKPLKYSHRAGMTFMGSIWMHETAEFLNTSASWIAHSCPSSKTNMFDPCYWNHLKRNKIDIDVTGLVADGTSEGTAFEIMETTLVSGDVIAVPRSAVSMVQLFMMPFSWQVWTTLALILAMAEIVHQIFPRSLKNDPIMLALCGFEKYDLHRSGQLEKFLLMPLIVLMFFSICAYETKLLSLMTSKPAAKTIRTIQELVDSGIQIKANLLTDFLLINDTMISSSLVNATVDVFNMDMVHAYLLEQSTAQHFCARYYDPDQRIHRYAILEEKYAMQSILFILGTRSPLREIFLFTLVAFVESGLYDYIDQRSLKTDKKHAPLNISGTMESDTLLYFADFRPVWTVFALGTGVSVLAFAIEVICHEIGKKIFKK